jgi:hypothetical protein
VRSLRRPRLVRCGTTTELYRWTVRDNICTVGGHVADDATEYKLLRANLLPRIPKAD